MIVSSKLHVRAATERVEFLEQQIVKATAPLREEIDKLTEAVDGWIIANYEASDGYEDDKVKLTKVVSYRRSWNPEKLRKLLPTKLYKLVIDVTVNKNRLDELVREGKIDPKKIESAYEETPNKPYVKRTDKSDTKTRGEEEAANLAAALK